MKKYYIFVWILLFVFPGVVGALSDAIKKKYPYSVMTDDYEILTERDLDTELDGVTRPTSLPGESYFDLYWQCFPRERITVHIKDLGYTSEDIGGEENYGSLRLNVWDESGSRTLHEYGMRRTWGTGIAKERMKNWIKLMKNEKYVCVYGSFAGKRDLIENGEKHLVSSWIFDKLKTKKGCDSYFSNDCHS